MLAKKRYARHAIQNKAITIFFLSLVLISLFAVATARASPNQIAPAGFVFGLGPFRQGDVVPIDIPLSANSIIFVKEMGYLYGIVVGFDWNPSGAKWVLKNPSNDAVYTIDGDTEFKQIGGLPDLPDWAIFFPITWQWFFSPKTYIFRVDVPDMKVPAFPTQGMWKAELYLYDIRFGFFEDRVLMVSYHMSVTESTILDNIMAPIYLSWGGIEAIDWGAFSIALPGIFWITSPFWIFAIFFILLALYKRSIRLAIALIKESAKRFREGLAKKV